MNSLKERLTSIQSELPQGCTLVAVSKTKPSSAIMEAHGLGQLHFGENKVQELIAKEEELPNDIKWHMIGHLQSNKVKYIARFVHLIHGVDSFKLLKEINKQAIKVERSIDCLLQVHIAQEDTKFGLSSQEIIDLLNGSETKQLTNVNIIGLMGMATNTSDQEKIRKEFSMLKSLFDQLSQNNEGNIDLKILSMGMSSDYKIAIQEGSNMVRIGSTIFGARQ